MANVLFKPYELVDRDTYSKFGDSSLMFIDNRALETLDDLKTIFYRGTMVINNWHWNGDRQWSGLRTPESPYYSTYSQHSFGRAIDFVCSDYTPEEIRQFILNNNDKFPHIRRLEKDVNWVHFDLANTGSEDIILFKG